MVGVLPASFEPLYSESDLWLPLAIDPGSEEHWDWITYALYGRLRAGATVEGAGAELRACE